jgi:hypothetical protein
VSGAAWRLGWGLCLGGWLLVTAMAPGQEAAHVKQLERALGAGDFEAVERLLLQQRDAHLGQALRPFDRERFVADYQQQHHGETPTPGMIETVERLSMDLQRQILRQLARWPYVLGLNALLMLDYQKAVSYFAEALIFDPDNAAYRQALHDAQTKAPAP